MIDRFWWWLAWRLPRRLAYLTTVRVATNATQGEWSKQEVPALTAMDALRRWEKMERTA